MNEASGTPTPRTDALHAEFPFNAGANYIFDHARQIERELQQAQQHAEYEARRANGAIKEMVAMQDELQQARTMHAEAVEEWAKWEGAAKQARGEALAVYNKVREIEDTLAALKPSPASGEQINATEYQHKPQHYTTSAAVPGDPVAVLLSLMPKQDVGVLRFPEWHKAIRALAAHYEAKGMRRAAEIARTWGKAPPREGGRRAELARHIIIAADAIASAKQEADHDRR